MSYDNGICKNYLSKISYISRIEPFTQLNYSLVVSETSRFTPFDYRTKFNDSEGVYDRYLDYTPETYILKLSQSDENDLLNKKLPGEDLIFIKDTSTGIYKGELDSTYSSPFPNYKIFRDVETLVDENILGDVYLKVSYRNHTSVNITIGSAIVAGIYTTFFDATNNNMIFNLTSSNLLVSDSTLDAISYFIVIAPQYFFIHNSPDSTKSFFSTDNKFVIGLMDCNYWWEKVTLEGKSELYHGVYALLARVDISSVTNGIGYIDNPDSISETYSRTINGTEYTVWRRSAYVYPHLSPALSYDPAKQTKVIDCGFINSS